MLKLKAGPTQLFWLIDSARGIVAMDTDGSHNNVPSNDDFQMMGVGTSYFVAVSVYFTRGEANATLVPVDESESSLFVSYVSTYCMVAAFFDGRCPHFVRGFWARQ